MPTLRRVRAYIRSIATDDMALIMFLMLYPAGLMLARIVAR